MAEHQSDAMIERLERELEERSAFIQGTIGSAQDGEGRDLTTNEKEMITSAKGKMVPACKAGSCSTGFEWMLI